MRRITDQSELERLHRAGHGTVDNDLSGRGASGSQYNVLLAAACAWVMRSSVTVPKYWFPDLVSAIAWLVVNRWAEGLHWKRYGTCGAGDR